MRKTKNSKILDLGNKIDSFVEQKNCANMRIEEGGIYLEFNGDFSGEETLFIRDNGGKKYVLIPDSILSNVIEVINKNHEERLRLELERDIMRYMPIDFDDVFAVAKQRVEENRRKDGSLPEIDTQNLIKDIKQEFPNLFFDFDEYISRDGLIDS